MVPERDFLYDFLRLLAVSGSPPSVQREQHQISTGTG